MGFQVTGNTTISDVRDGVSPPTIYLTNENHTFVADADGDVMDFSSFMSEVQVFVGTTQYTYTAGTPTGSQFTIGARTFVPANAFLNSNVDSSGVITISDQSGQVTGFAHGETVNTATLTVPVTVAGFGSTFNRVITFSKSIGGSAPIVRISSNTQTVEYDQNGVIARTDNIVITANEINFTDPGTVTFTYASGSGSFQTLAGSGITISTGDPETATITPTAFNTLLGNNRTVTFRATRGTVFDQITVARVNDGESAVTVVIAVTSGSTVLRSDTDVVVLRADVYRAGTLQTPVTSGDQTWTYQWSKDGTDLTSANQEAMTGISQQTGQGFNQRSLRIDGSGITDNGASLFACVVTEPNP